MEFKGKTTKELLNLDIKDFNALSRSDLSKLVSRLGSTANKRIKALEKSKTQTPATYQLSRSGGTIATKGKNINQLRAEYVRARNFLMAETSTKRGFEDFKEHTIKGLEIEGITGFTDNQFTKLWKAYEIVKEISPEANNKKFKYEILEEIAKEVVKGGRVSAKTIANKVNDKLTEIYEKNRESRNSVDVSSFFEFE